MCWSAVLWGLRPKLFRFPYFVRKLAPANELYTSSSTSVHRGASCVFLLLLLACNSVQGEAGWSMAQLCHTFQDLQIFEKSRVRSALKEGTTLRMPIESNLVSLSRIPGQWPLGSSVFFEAMQKHNNDKRALLATLTLSPNLGLLLGTKTFPLLWREPICTYAAIERRTLIVICIMPGCSQPRVAIPFLTMAHWWPPFWDPTLLQWWGYYRFRFRSLTLFDIDVSVGSFVPRMNGKKGKGLFPHPTPRGVSLTPQTILLTLSEHKWFTGPCGKLQKAATAQLVCHRSRTATCHVTLLPHPHTCLSNSQVCLGQKRESWQRWLPMMAISAHVSKTTVFFVSLAMEYQLDRAAVVYRSAHHHIKASSPRFCVIQMNALLTRVAPLSVKK